MFKMDIFSFVSLYVSHIYFNPINDIRLSIDNDLDDLLFWSRYV